MIRYKLFGILWMFVLSLPKIFPSISSTEKPDPTPNEIKTIPATDIDLETKPLQPIKVTASVYFPVESQTDDTPLVTADGSKINEKRPRKHRWIAVSRNLLRRWGGPIDYGDTLQVKGISKKLDGYYIVRDTMEKRMKNRIDILVGSDDNIMGFWKNVKIYHLN